MILDKIKISFFNFSDGTEEKYYLDIKGSDLKSGRVDVDFDVAGATFIIFGAAFVTSFTNLDFLSDTIFSMITSVTLLGIVPISLFNAIALMAMNSKDTLIGPILGASIGVVALSAGTLISNIIQGATTDNFGQLLGFSISCLLLFIMISNFDNFKIKGLGFLKTYVNSFLYIHLVSMILTATMGVVAQMFPENTVLRQVLLFIARIFTIVPTIGGVMVGGLTLSIIVSAGKFMGDEVSLGGKIFLRSYAIYKNILLFGALAGFLTVFNRLIDSVF